MDAVAEDHQEVRVQNIILCSVRKTVPHINILQMYTYYDQYIKSTGDPDAQDRWARQFIWEVARHAVGEELVIYPLMEKHLGVQGQKLADEDRKDHQVLSSVVVRDPLLTPC